MSPKRFYDPSFGEFRPSSKRVHLPAAVKRYTPGKLHVRFIDEEDELSESEKDTSLEVEEDAPADAAAAAAAAPLCKALSSGHASTHRRTARSTCVHTRRRRWQCGG